MTLVLRFVDKIGLIQEFFFFFLWHMLTLMFLQEANDMDHKSQYSLRMIILLFFKGRRIIFCFFIKKTLLPPVLIIRNKTKKYQN